MICTFKTTSVAAFLLILTLIRPYDSLAAPPAQSLWSGRSHAALCLYGALKVLKKSAVMQKLDSYYDSLRTTEQGALHYGISSAIIEFTIGFADQLTSAGAFMEGVVFISISGLTRTLQKLFAATSLGITVQRNIEESGILPAGSEQLCQEGLICILSAVIYIQLKKLQPLLLQQ